MALCASVSICRSGVIDLKNPGFEDGLTGWTQLEKGVPMSTISPDAAHEGKAGLHVEDTDRQLSSSFASASIPAQPGKTYRVTFFARTTAAGKCGVYLRFHDASRQVIKSGEPPSVRIDTVGEWHPYTLESVAPEGTAALSIWVHSWGGATCSVDLDDFALEEAGEVAGNTMTGPPPVSPPVQTIAAAAPSNAPGSSAARAKPAMIVIKVDDLKTGTSGRLPAQWQRFRDIIEARKTKAGIGIICNSLEGEKPAYVQWLKDVKATGLVEFWFHGYAHDVHVENGVECAEMVGRTYEDQRQRFEQSLRLASEKAGLTLQTFGPPGGGKNGSFDEATHRVMADIPAMKVWLYPQPIDEAGKKLEASGKVTILDRVWAVNIEQPLFKPNAQKFIEGYKKYPGRDYFVIQGHPQHWTDEGFSEFEKILDFLVQEKAVFVTPAECAMAVATGKSGRAAVDN